MIVETAVESYRFACARCAARWTDSYQVSQVNDDAGVVSSFYRHHGAPVEAPVTGNVMCPSCGSTLVRKDPVYATAPAGETESGLAPSMRLGVPVQRPGAAVPSPRRRAAGTWHRFKFSAVLSMDPVMHRRAEYQSGVPGLIVHVPSPTQPSLRESFPAVVFTDDKRPLRPGDKGIRVAITVPDDDASEFFVIGQRFTLWDDAEIGHGTVAERIYFGWPELA